MAFPYAIIDSFLHFEKVIPSNSRGSPSSPPQIGDSVGKICQGCCEVLKLRRSNFFSLCLSMHFPLLPALWVSVAIAPTLPVLHSRPFRFGSLFLEAPSSPETCRSCLLSTPLSHRCELASAASRTLPHYLNCSVDCPSCPSTVLPVSLDARIPPLLSA